MEVIVDLEYRVMYRPTGIGRLPLSEGFSSSAAADAREVELRRQGYLVFRSVGAPSVAQKPTETDRRRRQ